MQAGYRSGLEEDTEADLLARGVAAEFEKHVIRYQTEPRDCRYTPDFRLPNGIFVETKGYFTAADRKKHLLIQKQHPNLDLRFVFQRPNARLYKGSKTTYAQWCDKHGFKWAAARVPQEWCDE